MAEADDGLDLLGGVRQKNGFRKDAKVGEAVAFVGVEFFGGSDETARANEGAEFGEEGGVHGEKDSTGIREEEDAPEESVRLLMDRVGFYTEVTEFTEKKEKRQR
jgi:hypothetical protein